jgi:membrane fusion protein (multidrug efflux system)
MPKLYEAEVNKAKAEARVAEIEYYNTKSLADSNVVSVNELAITKAKFDQAKAEVALAEAHLGFTQVRAPFDGIIDRFHVRPGSLVDEGELLTTLSDNSKMWVYFNVPEAEYLDYKIATIKGDSAQKVQLLMANNKVFNQEGIIETIEADFNHETGNIPFRATFPNPNGLLRNGETGNILIKEKLENALLIPQKATYEVLEKRYVFVVHEDGKIEARQIELGEELPHLFEVKGGLKSDEMILLDGLRKVRHNDQIEFHPVSADSVITHLNLYAE